MNKLLIILALAILSVTGRAYERLQGPTELLYWNKTQTDDGYTFFGAQGTTYLIDMEGRVVHTWPVGTNPRLLDNGHVLDATNSTTFVELDWNGSNVWSYTESRTGYFPHGDFLRIYTPSNAQFTSITGATIPNASWWQTPSSVASMPNILQTTEGQTLVDQANGYRITHDADGMPHVKRLRWHPRQIWLSLCGLWRRYVARTP